MKGEVRFYSSRKDYFELSNFAPVHFEEGGLVWPTVEHYFQAQKFPGTPYQETIRLAKTPGVAKQLGQTRNFPIRSDWEQVKEDIMLRALRLKFAVPRFKELLLSTNKKMLIEDSPRDSYWGIGRSGKGRNRLGVLLMRVREQLMREG